MSVTDWIVLIGTLGFIVIYGTLKTRKNKDLNNYLRGGDEASWLTIGLSVMATQASAITFISTPGQAFESGLGFVQNYFGLPIALIIVSAVFIPMYYKLKVYTAYEFLENRFGIKTRLLAATLFLIQRGFAAGITIYAPAIILSTALGWNLNLTIIFVGVLVIIYTVSGGTKAVSLTQKWQMLIIMLGMFIAFGMIVNNLPENVSFFESIQLASSMGKLDAVNFSFDISERYTFWSGILGGTFLALSYFGTDQSQVQRYIGGQSIRESRLGLLFNATLKVPMQYFILFTGVMVFIFYQFTPHKVLFDNNTLEQIHKTPYSLKMKEVEEYYDAIYQEKKLAINDVLENKATTNEIIQLDNEAKQVRKQAFQIRNNALPNHSSKDSDYVFLSFIMNYLPHGIIGLLLAVIISAAMSSTASELNALASTTTIDYYKRLIKTEASDKHYLRASKWLTLSWGIIALFFALYAHLVENLIEAVNILGSIFYGTILGIFIVAFFIKHIQEKAVFIAALFAQLTVIILYVFYQKEIGYLWYNVIGSGILILTALIIQNSQKRPENS